MSKGAVKNVKGYKLGKKINKIHNLYIIEPPNLVRQS